jgi:toxin ParE1/3/4
MSRRIAPAAESDLDEIWLYIARETSVDSADRFVDSLTSRLLLLATYPHAGRERDDVMPGLRAFPVGEYMVLYRVKGDDVVILRVVRGSRDLSSLPID